MKENEKKIREKLEKVFKAIDEFETILLNTDQFHEEVLTKYEETMAFDDINNLINAVEVWLGDIEEDVDEDYEISVTKVLPR